MGYLLLPTYVMPTWSTASSGNPTVMGFNMGSGILCHTLAYSGILWHTLAYSGIPWHTLAYSGILWHTLTNSCILWHTLAYPGILWHTLAHSGPTSDTPHLFRSQRSSTLDFYFLSHYSWNTM